MSTVTVPLARSYLEEGFSLWSWIASVDHKTDATSGNRRIRSRNDARSTGEAGATR